MSSLRHGPAARGTALLEVLVALYVLAVTLLGVGRVQLWSVRESRVDAQYEQAHAAAGSVVGLLRGDEPADLLARRLARWREAGMAALHDAEVALVEGRLGEPAFVVVRWAGAGVPAGRPDGATGCRDDARDAGRDCVALAF